MLRLWSQFVPNMSADIRGHEALRHRHLESQATKSQFQFSVLPSTPLRGVYSETFIHRYNIPLAHSFTRLYIFCFCVVVFAPVHPALSLFPLVSVYNDNNCIVSVFVRRHEKHRKHMNSSVQGSAVMQCSFS